MMKSEREKLFSEDQPVILCATNRLARNIRVAYGQNKIKNGASIWLTPQATTVDVWLSRIGEQISLLGEVSVDQIPNRVLSPFQECLVWKQSIEALGGEDSALPLFDLHSLARTSTEANALINTWHLSLSEDSGSEETQQFIGWRKRFHGTCRKNGWLDLPAYQQRIFRWLESGAGILPSRVVFAGFDTLSPHLNELQTALLKRGVDISKLELSANLARTVRVIKCDDANAECRAAAAWSRKILEAQPDARIGVVVADLEVRRTILVPILDEALDPASLAGSADSPPGRYNVSLGLPLNRHEMVRAALALLRVLGHPQGIPLTEFGDLLRMPYWSADRSEADLRALVDAKLRERPGQTLSIDTLLRVAKTLDKEGKGKLLHHLGVLKAAQLTLARPRKPSAWAIGFRETLGQLGWPGERKLSSTEFQTRAAFFDALAAFAELDVFLGNIDISTATSELGRLCKEKIFQPETLGQPAVQVLGLLEAKGAEFDALWVMGMNDQYWPPPARPNPLLSAELQRRHGTPGASAEKQTEFARGIHERLRHSAPDITFSYAVKDGERDLRASPLIADLLGLETPPDVTLASEFFRHLADENHEASAFERLDDHRAPALAPGEKVSGGCGLLKAQAICPAWAFYRYRLGARKLETPSEGLDASRRGTMVHAMLEVFWTAVKDSARLNELGGQELQESVAAAAESALSQFEATQGETLSATFRTLEANRLQRLGLDWLTVESKDPANLDQRLPFRVVACEEQHTVSLGQLRINLVIDRVDELIADGRRIVLDYKTGNTVDTKSWFGERRITEPQLPLYAALVLARPEAPPVAAVAFAKVRLRECKFIGVGAEGGVLPGAKGIRSPLPAPDDEAFAGDGSQDGIALGDTAMPGEAMSEGEDVLVDAWQALLDSWRARLESIADEIQCGEAAVRFEDEKLLAYCDVMPLLRLTERKIQFEKCREVQP